MAVDTHLTLETRKTDLPVFRQWIDERSYAQAGTGLTAYLVDNPLCPEGWFLYGRLMLEQDHPAQARMIYEWLTVQPDGDRWENWLNLGKAWEHINAFDDAEKCYKRALALEPDHQTILTSLGTCYVSQYKSEAAEQVLRHTLDLYPDARMARSSLGFALLQQRKWGEGWDYYEAGYGKLRWRTERNYTGEPLWSGKCGKKIRCAVHGEQGIGDQIAGLEPLGDMARDRMVVSVEVSPKIAPLVARSYPDLDVYGTLHEQHIEWPLRAQVNCHAGLFTLHRHYRRDESDYSGAAYLTADPQRRLMWRALLDSLGPGPKIGIAWSGGAALTHRASRRAPLERWIPILRQSAHFISLEYKDRSADIEALQRRRRIDIHDFPWATQTDDYDDTAALVAELDLVICVPTSVVHLAGALGVPVWCMVHETPNIHYTGRGDTLAYYGDRVRLYRRDGDDWTKCVNQIAKQLECWIDEQTAA